MGTSIQFDLNVAFRDWRERLQQSPHFRVENLDELESHLRDSVGVLQSKGLSADEAFLIGMRRVGTTDLLETQFAAENGGRGWRDVLRRFTHRYKNKAAHGFVLGYFTLGCWLLWGCLRVSQMMEFLLARIAPDSLPHGSYLVPGFTRLFWNFMPFWYVLPAFAAMYCGFVWLRRVNDKSSWLSFLAIATAILFLLLVPILIAVALPVIDFLNHIPKSTFK